MKFRFDVGDRVRVLDGKSIDSWDSDIDGYTGSWDPSMERHVGRIATVLRPVAAYSRPAYRLRFGDYEDWHDWDERGLECVCEPRFKEGDRVRVLNTNCGQDSVDIESVLTISSVERIGKHILYNVKENNYAWFDSQFSPMTDETIVIRRNGNAVIARDCTLGLIAEAKCSPDDKFDFYTGAVLALERLREMECKQRPIEVGDVVRVIDARKCRPYNIIWFTTNCVPVALAARYRFGYEFGGEYGVYSSFTEYRVELVKDGCALISEINHTACYLFDLDGLERVDDDWGDYED